MAGRKSPTVRGARSWIGTLIVAWTFVSGSALIIATAHYQRSGGDIAILIAWLSPPFAMGVILFTLVGIVSLASGVKDRPVEVVNHTGTRQSIFRK